MTTDAQRIRRIAVYGWCEPALSAHLLSAIGVGALAYPIGWLGGVYTL